MPSMPSSGPVRSSKEIPNEFKPRAENKGLPIGHKLQVVVEKREKSIRLRIKDAETGEYAVDHTWDLADGEVLENREPPFVKKGRIGIRQMGGAQNPHARFQGRAALGSDLAPGNQPAKALPIPQPELQRDRSSKPKYWK